MLFPWARLESNLFILPASLHPLFTSTFNRTQRGKSDSMHWGRSTTETQTVRVAFIPGALRVKTAPLYSHCLSPVELLLRFPSAAALLVFDITDADSFARVKSWVKELRKMAGALRALCIPPFLRSRHPTSTS